MLKEFKYSLERESKRSTRVLCLAVGSPAQESCCCRTGGSAAEDGPPGRAEGWGQWGTRRSCGSWASPACRREGRPRREALGLFHCLMGGHRQHPARLFSEVHSKGRRQLSQSAGREIPAGQKEKIIFPVREIRCKNELPRESVGSPTWRCSGLDWPRS